MPDLPSAQLAALAHLQIVNYCRVAPAAIWALEFLLTFDDELRVIWKAKKWSYTHVMFFIVRYLPVLGFAFSIIHSFPRQNFSMCLWAYKLNGCALVILMLTTEGILCLRTLALWYNRRMVKIALVTLYLLVCIVTTVCIAVVRLSTDPDGICSASIMHSPMPHSTLGSTEGNLLTGGFSTAAGFEFVIVCLTLARSSEIGGIRTSSRLLMSLREGNLLYAVTLFAMSTANMVFSHLPMNEGWMGLLDGFQGVLHGVMASRIVLSLRNADSLTGVDRLPESVANISVGPIQFASPPEEATGVVSTPSQNYSHA
ncbi:hypothetical protein CONPUDRAFT_165712 [Coniophora puteana RWD-64-598 SS2]|uniref:DUF6533 domain-containing protein n=1 Tax=Coniophora puteana (strain RWD-64-598) TaxID=741705 RepID=A0A5M3MRC0_CONPW|nr:uncharacterized protein CONPUDRAFT_165712 [Coniophora puteana RWD-64-598 SS2]EIW81616.1 hypothetical protein CONPUDRAFT_165712 [Coniophora puteana RWD-64-598 SS2]